MVLFFILCIYLFIWFILIFCLLFCCFINDFPFCLTFIFTITSIQVYNTHSSDQIIEVNWVRNTVSYWLYRKTSKCRLGWRSNLMFQSSFSITSTRLHVSHADVLQEESRSWRWWALGGPSLHLIIVTLFSTVHDLHFWNMEKLTAPLPSLRLSHVAQESDWVSIKSCDVIPIKR